VVSLAVWRPDSLLLMQQRVTLCPSSSSTELRDPEYNEVHDNLSVAYLWPSVYTRTKIGNYEQHTKGSFSLDMEANQCMVVSAAEA
jgi:hypothetical protein